MTLQDHIDTIMDYFDFDKVHRAMTALGWEWASCEESHVPEIAELRQRARALIKEAWEKYQERHSPVYIGTGGFEVVVGQHGGGDIVSLKFVLEEFETNPNPDDTFTINK